MELNGIAKELIERPPTILVYVRKCKSGEEYTIDGTCVECPYGRYLMDPPLKITPCNECKISMNCYGGNRIAPRDGYFRDDIKSDLII